jgi:hypothetical protein
VTPKRYAAPLSRDYVKERYGVETRIKSCWFEQNTSRLRRKERVVAYSEVIPEPFRADVP